MHKLLLLFFVAVVLFFPLKSYAVTSNVGVLEITYPGNGALFNETNIAPGFEVVKTVSVKNTGQVPHSFSIAVLGQLGNLANVLQIEPRNFDTGAPIWNKTISNLAKAPNSDIILGSIASGETRQVNIAAILPESVGNEYQDTSTFSFDFVVGNESTDPLEPTDQNSNTNSIISTNLNDIFALGTNRNVNGSSTNVNSNTSLVNENTNAIAIIAVNEEGQAAGATTDNERICFWWWILWAAMALFLIIYSYVIRKRRGWFFEFWPVFTGTLVFVVHWILHNYYHPSKWCGWWFFGILLAEIVVYYIVRLVMSKNKKAEE